VVPPDVLAAIEEKKRKVATKNVTMVVKLKKRKGMAGPKALAKKVNNFHDCRHPCYFFCCELCSCLHQCWGGVCRWYR
jgi:hypothetical protein